MFEQRGFALSDRGFSFIFRSGTAQGPSEKSAVSCSYYTEREIARSDMKVGLFFFFHLLFLPPASRWAL